jgi:hypothetical protein
MNKMHREIAPPLKSVRSRWGKLIASRCRISNHSPSTRKASLRSVYLYQPGHARIGLKVFKKN